MCTGRVDLAFVLRAFQKATMAVKYAKVPVVAAPYVVVCERALAKIARITGG